ncbi:uncharacterized protein I206_105302 [Kwoniella pini CBS 10737]|uniref:Uncharacterized protein n=1 Tax=Kwoniella pini CBS 10737 TaxID=1296096 RepID=A0A1B9I4M4_9TREE|nr:uncharacterized protein I206_03788 [Kwoniella pini CBS 10737]OCF50466.1 hypothetical protein I206_03788 [Kwoniella pini CBS 10737]
MTSITPQKVNRISAQTTCDEKISTPTRRSTISPSSPMNSNKIIAPGNTPQNTPISKSIHPINKRSTLPLPTSGKPINAASAILGRGVTNGNNGQHAHAVTPGNTLNSLEQITNRLADSLGGISDGENTGNKIAPTYERNFKAGLGDLHRRLSSPEITKDQTSPIMSPTAPSSLISARHSGQTPLDNEWPSSFSDLDVASSSITSQTIRTPSRRRKSPEFEQK